MPNRTDAWTLLCEYTANENLRKHALAVEACARAYARKRGEDETLWGITALLHDFDYERWPNQEHHPSEGHPSSGVSILRERGYPEEMIHAILGHADYTGVMRETTLDHVLFACDEMAGFLTACALIRPGKTIFEVEPGSVKKRMKDKAFARGVSRDDLLKGAEELGVPIEKHMATCIEAMCGIAESLGLERKS
jgi:putative nucleotidyltransferase with HDIG domain